MYSVDVYLMNKVVCRIHVDKEYIRYDNLTDNPLWLPFGVRLQADYKDLLKFYESRCFPRERENCRQVLNDLGLSVYDPEAIVRKTHGVQFDDFIWLQFSDEPQVIWEEVRLR